MAFYLLHNYMDFIIQTHIRSFLKNKKKSDKKTSYSYVKRRVFKDIFFHEIPPKCVINESKAREHFFLLKYVI